MKKKKKRGTGSKTPAEIILGNVYAHSCRLEAVISRLRPSCRLYDRETDTPSYVALCSSSLVANESLNLLSCDLSDLEKLASMNHPQNSKIVRVGAEPLESLLRLIPVEKFTVDLRYFRKRQLFLKYLMELGFDTLNSRIGSGLLLCLLVTCSLFIPLENDCYLQMTGDPIYQRFPLSAAPMKKPKRLIFKRLLRARRRKRKRKRSSSETAESSNMKLETDLMAPPSELTDPPSTSLQSVECRGFTVSALQDLSDISYSNDVSNELRESDLFGESTVLLHDRSPRTTEGEGNPTDNSSMDSADCRHFDTDLSLAIFSDTDSSLDSDRCRGKKRSLSPPSSPDRPRKRAKREKDWRWTKKKVQKLRRRLEGREDLSRHQKAKIRRYLQRKRRRRRKHSKMKKKKMKKGQTHQHRRRANPINHVIDGCYMFYSSSMLESFTNAYPLQVLPYSVNGARKLVLHVFKDSPIPGPAKQSTSGAQLSSNCAKKNEIGQGKRGRLSKRLQKSLPLFQQLLYNHKHKVYYPGLLDHYCPVSDDLLKLAASVSQPNVTSCCRVEEKKEEGCGKDDGASPELFDGPLDTSEVRGGENGGQLLGSKLSAKDAITRLTSEGRLPLKQVYKFLKAVIKHLVPMAMWGSAHNRRLFFKHMKAFVRLRRFEFFDVQALLEGYKLSCCDWLKLPSPSGRGSPYPPHYPLCKKFLRWMMTEVVVRTIKAHFYVTDHSVYRNQVFYYRKKLWKSVEMLALKERVGSLFSPITEHDVQRMCSYRRSLGVSKLRFFPKKSGVRPIINLRSVVRTDGGVPNSINYHLQSAFLAITHEVKRRPWLLGSSCFGHSSIYTKLREFTDQQRSIKAKGPLYFIHVDIASCYDSILATKLSEILVKEVMSQESYLLRRYCKVHLLSSHRARRRFIKVVVSRSTGIAPFYEVALELSRRDHSCIYTDQITYPVLKRAEIMDQLKKHIFANVVKLGLEYFRQSQGIPQGSKLSSLLCGLYYANMERECLPKVDPNTGLLLRYTDDFLLITRDTEVAKTFLAVMERGVPEYNCCINADKSGRNFEIHPSGDLELKRTMKWFEWCGFLLNTSTLDVRMDSSRYTVADIRSCVSVKLVSNPILCLRRFMKRSVQLRCLPILLDGKLLSARTVALNVYEGFIVVAMKFIVYVQSLPGYPWKREGVAKGLGRKHCVMFFRMIMNSIYIFIRRAQSTCSKVSGSFDLPSVVCWWLTCAAYKKVLETHRPERLMLLNTLISSRMKGFLNAMTIQWIKLCHRTAANSVAAESIPLYEN